MSQQAALPGQDPNHDDPNLQYSLKDQNAMHQQPFQFSHDMPTPSHFEVPYMGHQEGQHLYPTPQVNQQATTAGDMYHYPNTVNALQAIPGGDAGQYNDMNLQGSNIWNGAWNWNPQWRNQVEQQCQPINQYWNSNQNLPPQPAPVPIEQPWDKKQSDVYQNLYYACPSVSQQPVLYQPMQSGWDGLNTQDQFGNNGYFSENNMAKGISEMGTVNTNVNQETRDELTEKQAGLEGSNQNQVKKIEHLLLPSYQRSGSEISNSSLQTVNYSRSSSIENGKTQSGDTEEITKKLKNALLTDKAALDEQDHASLYSPSLDSHLQSNNSNKTYQEMPHSIFAEDVSQQGSFASDWELVHDPSGSTQHSRQSSLENVQFVVGSGQNSPGGGTPNNSSQPSSHPTIMESFDTVHGQSAHLVQSEFPQVTLAPNLLPPQSDADPALSISASSAQCLVQDVKSPSDLKQDVTLSKRNSFGNTNKFDENLKMPEQFLSDPEKVSVSSVLPLHLENHTKPLTDSNHMTSKAPECNQHFVNVYASAIQPRETSPFQPPPSRQTSVQEDKSELRRQAPTSTVSSELQNADCNKDRSRHFQMLGKSHQSHYHSSGYRVEQNMSPAATLWDNPDVSAGGIILTLAAPVLSLSALHSSKEQAPSLSKLSSDKLEIKNGCSSSEKKITESQSASVKKSSHIGPSENTKKSIVDSEAETLSNSSLVTSTPENKDIRQDEYPDFKDNFERDRLVSKERNFQNKNRDRLRGNYRRYCDKNDPHYRNMDAYPDYRHLYDSYYDRPPSRAESFQGDYERFVDYYRSYCRDRDAYPDVYAEHYDRPRSRQDERPPSRTESERPRSRAEYDRVYWPRYRGDYSDYEADYQRSVYYNYYLRDRYARGYYDEFGSYDRYYDPHSRYTDYYAPYGGYDDVDRASHHSQEVRSHRHTPALEEPGTTDPEYQGYVHLRDYDRHTALDYNYQHYYGAYDDYADWSLRAATDSAPGRMTPLKFFTPHVRAFFGTSGHLVKVLPNRPTDGQPASIEIYDLESLLAGQPELEQLRSFPGPLIKGETYKNDVLVYCQQKAKECAENISMIDRDSAELLWKFLELLIKQNGTVVGTDIADLLLEGHQPNTSSYTEMKALANSDALEDEGGLDPTLNVTVEQSLVARQSETLLEDPIDRFRLLLLYGRKKVALRWAMKNNLWGQALFLGSKMDHRIHAEIMTKFANNAMKMNDPLQTLYQLMSSRQPAAVTGLSDENWGDWRPHLAMMLSNHSARPDLDRKSITTLGDALAAKGCLHASQFCYIMAQVSFGTYSKKSSKIVLIGSHHSLPLGEFATNKAIQCTEVFEYAQSLGNPLFTLPSFQLYKLMYACRLAESGFIQEALHYCEVIALAVVQFPTLYQPTLVKILYDTASRLKFHDPQRLQMGDDLEDPHWLQHIFKICQRFEDGSIQHMSGTTTPLYPPATTTASSDSGEVATYMQNAVQYQQPGYGQDGVYQNQQYIHNQPEFTGQDTSQPGQSYTSHNNQYEATEGYGLTAHQTHQQQFTGHQQQDSADENGLVYTAAHGYQGVQADITQPMTSTAQMLPPSDVSASYEGHNTQMQQAHCSSIASTSSVAKEDTDVDEKSTISNNSVAFDYFSAAAQKVVLPPSRHRQRTISESSTQSNGSVKKAPIAKTPPEELSAAPDKHQERPAQSGKGWLDTINIFSRLSRRNKNEMILPEDKKPKIIWDSDKNRWVNTDEDDEPEVPTAAPPKDAELSATSVPAGNIFSRPKGRGARSQYVDVLNPKATTSQAVPANLFSVLPSAPSAPQTIFNPSAGSTSQPTALQQQPQVLSGTTRETETLDPSAGELSRSSSMSSLSQEVQQFTQQGATHSAPMMFDPAQFENKTFKQPTARKGLRSNQRRVYPE